MSLAENYKRQFGWRDWPKIFDALPQLQGLTVLDLGCGVGDVAAELVARGARVIGIDMSEEFLREAKSRRLANAEFRTDDLRALPDLGVAADVLWCSFTTAYFPNLSAVLAAWTSNLGSNGWIVLTEIDDLFGHEPISDRAKALFRAYAEDALAAGRYDFPYGPQIERSFGAVWVHCVEDSDACGSGTLLPRTCPPRSARRLAKPFRSDEIAP